MRPSYLKSKIQETLTIRKIVGCDLVCCLLIFYQNKDPDNANYRHLIYRNYIIVFSELITRINTYANLQNFKNFLVHNALNENLYRIVLLILDLCKKPILLDIVFDPFCYQKIRRQQTRLQPTIFLIVKVS